MSDILKTSGITAAAVVCLGLTAAAGAGAVEKVQIETPKITIRSTLDPAAEMAKQGSRNVFEQNKTGVTEDEPSLVSLRWDAMFGNRISYTFHTKALDFLTLKQKLKPGTMFFTMSVGPDGKSPDLPPFFIIRYPGDGSYYKEDLAFNKELLPISGPYLDVDEVIGTLQKNLSVDLRNDLRNELCSCGARYTLFPDVSMFRRPGQRFNYTVNLALYAENEKPGGDGGCFRRGCREGSRISLAMDPATGEYLVRDFFDGLVYPRYLYGSKPAAAGKTAGGKAAASLKKAFPLFGSILSSGAGPRDLYRERLGKKAKPGAAELKPRRDDSEDFKGLYGEIAGKRLRYIKEAVKLQPGLAMAHAALGLLRSEDCKLPEPAAKDGCEKGLRALLKARALAPRLALPAYALVNRLNSPYFPKKLKPLVKETTAELCAGIKDTAPAWDWAYYGECACVGEKPGEWTCSPEMLERVKNLPVLRPGEILQRYLDLELAGK